VHDWDSLGMANRRRRWWERRVGRFARGCRAAHAGADRRFPRRSWFAYQDVRGRLFTGCGSRRSRGAARPVASSAQRPMGKYCTGNPRCAAVRSGHKQPNALRRAKRIASISTFASFGRRLGREPRPDTWIFLPNIDNQEPATSHSTEVRDRIVETRPFVGRPHSLDHGSTKEQQQTPPNAVPAATAPTATPSPPATSACRSDAGPVAAVFHGHVPGWPPH